MSILFYVSSEVKFVFIFLLLVLINFITSFLINKSLKTKRKQFLILAVIINLTPLFYFKYLIFMVDNILNPLLSRTNLGPITTPSIYLPLAISFFTFHTLSYLIDVYKKTIEPEKKLRDLALYLFLFPHLIAGPIVRFAELKDQIKYRIINLEDFIYGWTRFIIGLAKKVIIADNIAAVVNNVFGMQPENMSMETAWIGIIGFTLQIYLDFSAYSDMAIGLAAMFGFKFPENFNYPYIATSIRDFWQRWHMTLYRWFRDYVYIPLGGNRLSSARIYFNIMIVFALTGFWHGAGWNFILWGGIHGAGLVFERSKLGDYFRLLGKPAGHIYTLLIVIIGWVFFRSDSLSYSLEFLKRLFIPSIPVLQEYRPLSYIVNPENILALFLGILISYPIYPKIINLRRLIFKANMFKVISYGFLILIFLFTIFIMVASTYRTFIYFRF